MVEKHSDRFAFQQGGHFFYPKEGETLNQNWIVENLNNAFSTWNGKLTELWGLVTTSPQTFKGGAVWGVMQSLHNAMIGIGYALIVLFFAISLFKNTANFHELKRPEAAVHGYDATGQPTILVDRVPDAKGILAVHDACYRIEAFLISPQGGYTQFNGQDADGHWVQTRQQDVGKCIYIHTVAMLSRRRRYCQQCGTGSGSCFQQPGRWFALISGK